MSTVSSLRCAACRVQSAECSVQCAVCSLQSAVCRVQSAECSLQSAECRVQSAECRVQYKTELLNVHCAMFRECERCEVVTAHPDPLSQGKPYN